MTQRTDQRHHGPNARARVTVRLFAAARDAFGTDTIEVAAGTVAELAQELARRCPAAAGLIGRSRFAVNRCFVSYTSAIGPNDEVAVIPPVSGG